MSLLSALCDACVLLLCLLIVCVGGTWSASQPWGSPGVRQGVLTCAHRRYDLHVKACCFGESIRFEAPGEGRTSPGRGRVGCGQGSGKVAVPCAVQAPFRYHHTQTWLWPSWQVPPWTACARAEISALAIPRVDGRPRFPPAGWGCSSRHWRSRGCYTSTRTRRREGGAGDGVNWDARFTRADFFAPQAALVPSLHTWLLAAACMQAAGRGPWYQSAYEF